MGPAQPDVFSAVAAPGRRDMLRLLATREMPVTELASSFAMSLSAVSQHLAILREAGLVTQRKQGKQRLYRLNAKPLKSLEEWLDFYRPFWTENLDRLGRHLEENP